MWSGITDQAGKFRLTTYDTIDGAVVGKHQISLSYTNDDIPEEIPEDYDYAAQGESDSVVIPEKYMNPKSSGLVSTIVGDEDEKTVEIVVEE